MNNEIRMNEWVIWQIFLENFGCGNKVLIRPRHRWKDEIQIYLIEMGCEIIERILLIMDILSGIMNRRVKGRSREGGGNSAPAPGTWVQN
jgi:hypothetical protein